MCSVNSLLNRNSWCLPREITSRTPTPVKSVVAREGTRNSDLVSTRPASTSFSRWHARQTVSPSGTASLCRALFAETYVHVGCLRSAGLLPDAAPACAPDEHGGRPTSPLAANDLLAVVPWASATALTLPPSHSSRPLPLGACQHPSDVSGKHRLVQLSWLLLGMGIAGLATVAARSSFVRSTAAGHIYTESDVPAAPVALVLGAQVNPDGTPSAFLAARLDLAKRLYDAGLVEMIIVSGDHLAPEFDEPAAMRDYLITGRFA